MGKYILKRLLYIILVLFILSFIIFMVYDMMPNNKAAQAASAERDANKNIDYDERLEYWEKKYGLDGNKLER